MNKFFAAALAGMCFLIGMAAQAGDSLTVSNAWARATVPGQEVGAAYMELRSAAGATLTGMESPASDSVEIHSMSMQGEQMQMRMLEALPLPAGKLVQLEPGGLHLMLIGLKKPLKDGETIELTLHLKDGKGKTSKIKIEAPVRSGKN
ncbi:MAG TPA: copper chaperone PCu(A)C [Methylophilaceae bacterium]|nr:copper chaperone PCu(A)C [Methylophilaceae bacterium]HQR59880.1 copper chaperone PCu(A)C [Methylophilaceae bacterium]